jgi:hypothetical protein
MPSSFFRKIWPGLCLLVFLAGCSEFSFSAKTLGADELVLDSYAIKETPDFPEKKKDFFCRVVGPKGAFFELVFDGNKKPLKEVVFAACRHWGKKLPEHIYIVRSALGKTYHVRLEHLLQLGSQSLLLLPEDLVFFQDF